MKRLKNYEELTIKQKLQHWQYALIAEITTFITQFAQVAATIVVWLLSNTKLKSKREWRR